MFLRNVRLSPKHKALQPRSPYSSNQMKMKGRTLKYYFLKADRRSVGDSIRLRVWNSKEWTHYRAHKNSPLFLTLTQVGPVHTLTSYCLKIHFNIVFPYSLLPCGSY
jgi:hypothetical protein